MRVANTQLLFPYRPLSSISEFSAIAGSQANQMLVVMGVVQWVVLMTLFASEVQHNSGEFLRDSGNIMIMIGSASLFMCGFFDANRRDMGMMLMHCLGFVVAVVIIPLAAFLQCDAIHAQNRKDYWIVWVIPIFLMCISWPCLLGFWFIAMRPANLEQFEKALIAHIENGGSAEEYLKEARPKINKFAFQSLLMECVCVYCTCLTLAVYLGNWAGMPQCRFGCRNECNGCEYWCRVTLNMDKVTKCIRLSLLWDCSILLCVYRMCCMLINNNEFVCD